MVRAIRVGCGEGFFLAGKLFISSLKIPRRMFEGMIEELGSFHIHPFFFLWWWWWGRHTCVTNM
jgi:hypothetical protein